MLSVARGNLLRWLSTVGRLVTPVWRCGLLSSTVLGLIFIWWRHAVLQLHAVLLCWLCTVRGRNLRIRRCRRAPIRRRRGSRLRSMIPALLWWWHIAIIDFALPCNGNALRNHACTTRQELAILGRHVIQLPTNEVGWPF